MAGCMYLTVRAWSSIGAPERTAAGVVSPGSLPSITLAGTGEKFLRFVSAKLLRHDPEEGGGVRGAVV